MKKKNLSVKKKILNFYSKKLKDNGEIWSSIGIHGGLVGIWFITTSILDINVNAPSWIIGKETNDLNPIGGIYGITLMIAIIICKITIEKPIMPEGLEKIEISTSESLFNFDI